jgi:hypothetical protein
VKRSRGRGSRPQQVKRAFDFDGADVKIRGTAAHVYEKYCSSRAMRYRRAIVSRQRITSSMPSHYYRILMAQVHSRAAGFGQGQQPQAMEMATAAPGSVISRGYGQPVRRSARRLSAGGSR